MWGQLKGFINWALPEDFYLDITRRTIVGAPDALKLWDTIGENYRRVLGNK